MARGCATTSLSLSPIAWIISTITVSLVLLYFSLTPTPPDIDGLFAWDKLQHAVSLGVVAFITVRLCLALRVSLVQSTIIGFLYATLFGGIIELLQGMLDLAAD